MLIYTDKLINQTIIHTIINFYYIFVNYLICGPEHVHNLRIDLYQAYCRRDTGSALRVSDEGSIMD